LSASAALKAGRDERIPDERGGYAHRRSKKRSVLQYGLGCAQRKYGASQIGGKTYRRISFDDLNYF